MKQCDICGKEYETHTFGQLHAECVFKRQYLCKDCNVQHIALTQEEFDRKTCKGE